MQLAKKIFSRFGFAQLAGEIVIILVSLAMVPLVKPEVLQKLASTAGLSFVLLLTYVPNVFFLIAFWFIVRKLPKTEWQKTPMRFGSLLSVFVMMYAVSSIFNGLGLSISGAAPAGGSEQLDMIGKIVGTKLLVGFLIPAVIGPILEELVFRKLMIDRLHQYGETTVIVFTALCFGLFHGNLTQFLYATSVGLFLGYSYCKTGKVSLTILMHILLNTLSSSLVLLLPLMEGDSESSPLGAIAILAMFILIIILFISGFIQLIRHLKKKDLVLDDATPEAVPKKEVLKTVYLNPGVVLLFVFSIGSILADLFQISLPF